MSQDPNKSISKELDLALSEMGVSKEQKDRIAEDIGAAIYLNLLNHLYEELPLEKRDDFIKNVPDEPQEATLYFQNFIPKERLMELTKSSTREILDKFIGSMI